ncbi:MAG: hypothetical protein GXP49_08040 [Deltaproteobacteria bacterium]|nr:hypothetical protein [Deltaproteobacteria bacterium]
MVRLLETLVQKGLDPDLLLDRPQISPATCCLVSPDGEVTVDKAFSMTRDLAKGLRSRYKI